MRILIDILNWLVRPQQLLSGIILVAFTGSSIGVIYAAHKTREMYRQLQSLQQIQDDLDSEYEKLLLEQGAWARYVRVDQLAREELGMIPPPPESLVVIRDAGRGSAP